MPFNRCVLPSVAALVVAGCATQGAPTNNASAPPAAIAAAAPPAFDDYGPMQKVKSPDGKTDGEVIGSVAAGSKFSKLQIGMQMNEVLSRIGGPDGTSSHETGKRWIPFYFGGDARRVEVLYKGEGCLTYTGGNAWGGGDNQLIRITATKRVDCTE
ncbi:MAG: hypothetical protein M3R22_04230 [Pseudomonadota bacterium]|nr:hypothetical protein [Pseudomonadota bacterium]